MNPTSDDVVGVRQVTVAPLAVVVPARVLEHRLDPDYYNPAYFALLKDARRQGMNLAPLGQVSTLVNDGPGGWSLNVSEYVAEGVPMIRIVDLVKHLDPSRMVCITPEKHQELIRYEVLPGDLLITAAGSIGDAVVVPEDIAKASFRDLLRVRLKPSVSPHYLAAFLNCKYGKILTGRYAHGAVQLHLKVYDAKVMRIPLAAAEVQAYIGDKVRLAQRCRAHARSSQASAKQSLSGALGFDVYQKPPTGSTSTAEGCKVIGRRPASVLVSAAMAGTVLLAERYAPEFLARDEVLRQCEIRLAPLDAVAVDLVNGHDCRDFRAEGTPYLKVANVRPNDLQLDGVQFVPMRPAELPEKQRMQRGDVLITRKGSFGICTTVSAAMERMIFSSEVIRVPLRCGWDSDYVAFFLNSPYGRYQFDRLVTGTTMKGINHENLTDVKVPGLPQEVQREIGRHVRCMMSYELRARQLTHEAQSDLEALIEGRLDVESVVAGRLQASTWEQVASDMEAEVG